jgi:hypothetical protein
MMAPRSRSFLATILLLAVMAASLIMLGVAAGQEPASEPFGSVPVQEVTLSPAEYQVLIAALAQRDSIIATVGN